MKKDSTQPLLYREHSKIKYMAPIAVIFLLLVGVLGALLFTTAGLHKTLRQNTVDYANDVSAQLASNISYRMQTRETYIRNLADTFSEMPEFLLTEELLDRKAGYLEMEHLFVINADGTTLPAEEEHASLSKYLAEHPELYTDPMIFFNADDEVFFSAPILRKNGETSLLVGTRSNAILQQMLQKVDFKDQGLCCIVNQEGKVIVSATDETPFVELNDIFEIFEETVTTADDDEGKRVLADINDHRSGVAEFNAGAMGEDPILLGYHFLGINDWMLLTLISADLFSEDTTPYLICYITIICFLALVMLAILSSVIWYYRRLVSHIQSIALTDPLTGGHNDLAFRIDCEALLREQPAGRGAAVPQRRGSLLPAVGV